MIEDGFPEFFKKSDAHSLLWQARYLRSERAQLVCLLLAALCANFGRGGLVLVVLLFVVAVGSNIFRLVSKADQKWWNGRAGAESAKTVSWRYVVGGAPFSLDQPMVDQLLAQRLSELATKVADMVPVAVGTSAVTSDMRTLRAEPLSRRVEEYQRHRVKDQMEWYCSKSEFNEQRGQYWSWLAILAQVVGMGLGIVGLVQHLDFDFVGLLSAAAAAAVAWSAVKQHEVLARSYAVASNELGIIDAQISDSTWDEEGWAAFVNEAEEAISREHTSWRASRAV